MGWNGCLASGRSGGDFSSLVSVSTDKELKMSRCGFGLSRVVSFSVLQYNSLALLIHDSYVLLGLQVLLLLSSVAG